MRRTTKADQHVSHKLKQLRIDRGLSQSEVAEHLGVTFQQVQKYENGSNRVSAGRLFYLAKLFRCDVAEFFRGMK